MKKYWYLPVASVVFVFFILGLYWVYGTKATPVSCETISSSLSEKIGQLVIVQPKSTHGFQAMLTACQKQGPNWRQVFPTFPVVIGEKGVAAPEEKQEGDLKTPVGLYPLGSAFGWEPLALKLDYHYITKEDKFIDDPNSPDYNHWVIGETSAKSYESMLIEPYKMGILIRYNMDPTVKGVGSAIFVHLWEHKNQPTAGCIAMDEPHLLTLLQWLDKKQQPHIEILQAG